MVQWLRIRWPMQGTLVSTPGPGRSHMMLGNEACAPQPLSWHAAITETFMPRTCALQQNKSLQPEAYTAMKSSALLLATTRESPHVAIKTQCSQGKKTKTLSTIVSLFLGLLRVSKCILLLL